MGSKALIYKERLKANLRQSERHLERIKIAFTHVNMPLNKETFLGYLENDEKVAFLDQIIYRFSKLQDTLGAKVFKDLMLYFGENVNRPFLDILYDLEKLGYVNVEDWYEFRDLRNEISHNYEDNEKVVINIVNFIWKNLGKFEEIIKKIKEEVCAG